MFIGVMFIGELVFLVYGLIGFLYYVMLLFFRGILGYMVIGVGVFVVGEGVGEVLIIDILFNGVLIEGFVNI